MRALRHCLLTILSGKLRPIREQIVAHRRAICARCGMHCMVWDGPATRPASWMKVFAVNESLRTCAQTLWLDADATPRGAFAFPTATPPADLVAVRDANGLNAGIVLVKSTEWTRRLLDDVWRRVEYTHHRWWEQEALRRVLSDRPTRRARLTADVARHVDHIAGCFSTTAASVCRGRIVAAMRASNVSSACTPLRWRTTRVTPHDLRVMR